VGEEDKVTKKEIEHAIGNHADWIEHLGGRMDELAAAQARTQTQIEETNKSLRELGQATDKRIADLVSAIGSLVTQMREQKAQ
jgi:ABC-type transporter Mla subunit MlaD